MNENERSFTRKEMRDRQEPHARQRIDAERPSFPTVLWSAVVLFATVVLARRLSGSFVRLPGVLTSLALMASMALLAGIAHLLHFLRQNAKRSRNNRLIAAGLTLLPPAVVGGCLLPFDSPFAVSVWSMSILLTATALLWLDNAAGNSNRVSSLVADGVAASPIPFDSADPQTGPHDVAFTPAGDAEDIDNQQQIAAMNPPDEFAGASVTQWMSRSTANDGSTDFMEGAVKIRFAVGEKQSVVHLSFNPPFATLPKLACEMDEDVGVRLRTASLHPYGARIDARRSSEIDEPLEIEIGYTASATLPHEKAA